MSSGVCDQCGAHQSAGASSHEQAEARDTHLICAECGAEFEASRGLDAAEEPRGEVMTASAEASAGEAPSAEASAGEAPSAEASAGEPTSAPDAPAADAFAAADASVETEATASKEPASTGAASADFADSPPSDEAPTVRAPDVAPDAAAKDPDRDSSIPIESRDFVADDAPRQRRLPTAPARPQAPKADSEWLDELPVSVGTPTLAALVQRANSESERPAAPSIPPELLTDRSFDLAAGDWEARLLPMLRKPTTDAPVTSPSAAPGAAPSNRKSMVVVIAAVAAAAFAAGFSVKRPAPAATASLPAQQRAAELNIQAKPALAPPEFAIEPAAPEQNPAALPPAEGAPSSATSRATASEATESSGNGPLATGTTSPAVAAALPAAVAPPPGPAAAPATAPPKPETTPERPSTASDAQAAATGAPASTEPAFDAQAAEAAIGAAALRAVSCKQPGAPSGVAVVTITFSPSGRATTANVAGLPFAGTPTGGCIAATLRSARVPAFSGEFVTVKKSVTIE